ncbi:MAG: hypothetical protein NTX79_04585 [Candidatus Micrarchaeota archaeon]|nr:hypothetical protein [Candidatus Micrarchaeota archaeon]
MGAKFANKGQTREIAQLTQEKLARYDKEGIIWKSLQCNKPLNCYIRESGLAVLLDDPGLNRSVSRYAPIIEQVNSIIAEPNKRITLFVVQDKRHQDPLVSGGAYYYEGIVRCISGFLERPTPQATVFHEASHGYFESLTGESRASADNAFDLVAFRWEEKPWFAERSYSGGGGGHPSDNRSELFASASSILKYFYQGFFARIESNSDNPDISRVKRVIALIYLAWKDGSIFADEARRKVEGWVET